MVYDHQYYLLSVDKNFAVEYILFIFMNIFQFYELFSFDNARYSL